MPSESLAAVREPVLLADHVALDLLNTQAMVDGALYDFWQADSDVANWLIRVGMQGRQPGSMPIGGVLLATARELRAVARELITARKACRTADVGKLNTFLREAASYPQLVWQDAAAPHIERAYIAQSAMQLFAPLAEAIAQLLVEGDFNLVRSCEHPDCVLWFYDRTKAHKRRWCSMARCGNRAKVAEFRKRRQA
ncbi:MAG: CGNR zinc finger domain-containing protein [Burkholderiaceae bacterium]|nr:CGNR zinc finger domain-containing protein [Burkholderiaceae bacterium]